MKSITDEMIKDELTRMAVERELFGRFLLVGTGESQAFWNAQKPKRQLTQRLLRAFRRLGRSQNATGKEAKL